MCIWMDGVCVCEFVCDEGIGCMECIDSAWILLWSVCVWVYRMCVDGCVECMCMEGLMCIYEWSDGYVGVFGMSVYGCIECVCEGVLMGILGSQWVFGMSVHGCIECVCRGVLMGMYACMYVCVECSRMVGLMSVYGWIDGYVCVCTCVSMDALNACVMVYLVCVWVY